jgi:hypothetical protein
MIGFHTVPVPHDVPMFRDRSITGWVVDLDDTIIAQPGVPDP